MPFDPQPVYTLVDDIPKGAVASYGMIASLLPGVGARMVGRALGQLSTGSKTPWHRVVNAAGKAHTAEGRARLAKEGVAFRANGHVDWKACRWRGPSPIWLEQSGADPLAIMEITAGWER